ncbi:putative toxin-antitoxin system toxin component, PIN family [Lacihabitans soyangensis]|uniref:Toxin-antitoxin system toxin component, PIN family n=1 Tax=Lacihabitans soyangensis TaxID=869394 RepID=A0AAE3H411_9BACT|nr:putative toxin-antitoxin system toxin component, PIN family [Lacihabitans soyangensis]MCP9764734.1 putative toxin-antitoxin system toxin component, PIN family [Lacihabitans soyangensis]
MANNRYVLDTNVLISAIVWPDSIPHKALLKAMTSEVLISNDLRNELIEVFSRPKFDKYKSNAERNRELGNFIEKCTFIQVYSKLDVCRDKKDNMVLELAKDGNAILIVSGDDDLLSLNPFQGIQIITAREFLELA